MLCPGWRPSHLARPPPCRPRSPQRAFLFVRSAAFVLAGISAVEVEGWMAISELARLHDLIISKHSPDADIEAVCNLYGVPYVPPSATGVS